MRRATLAISIVLGLTAALAAQSRPPITRADYGQWETLSSGGGRGGLSPDGRWVTYGINRTNRENELRILNVADGSTRTVPFGSQAAFSSDSQWLAYAVGMSEAEQERLRGAQRPVENSLGLLSLATGETTAFEGIDAFAFSPDGKYLAMRRHGAQSGGGAAGAGRGGGRGGGGRGGGTAADPEGRPGVTLIVRQLASGRNTTFGNVGEYAWQDADDSHLLAMTINAEGQTGNGVHLFDPETTVLHVLDSAQATYAELTWRKGRPELAVLRSRTDDAHEGPTHAVIDWTEVAASAPVRHEFDPGTAPGFPAGMRIVSYRRPSWSDDGRQILLGIADWPLKPPPAPSRGRGAGPGGRGETRGSPAAEDEPASVDIWHWTDTEVMARQKLSANAERRRNLLSVWQPESGAFLQIARSFDEQVTLVPGGSRALVAEWSAYAMDRSIGRPAADLYLADLGTGARTRIKERINDRETDLSPGGRYLLFLQDDQSWTMDLGTHVVVNITGNVPASFVDKDSDSTGPAKPTFGVAGWTPGDKAVILYDRYDLWQVASDGSKAVRLTDGAADQVRHRLARIDPEADTIDTNGPVYVSLFGLRSKKSGYGIVRPGAGRAERVLWLDKNVNGLAKAAHADVFEYLVQDYDDSPDLFVGGDLAAAKPVTSTNAFQSNFAWGRSEIVEYKTARGLALQGALYYPAGYEPGRAYPMIVYLYERLSDNVHRYVAPSDRDYYNTSVFTSQGYFVLQPDIVFRPREPGLSVVECVTPAVQRVVQTGMVDPKRVGVVGHSWGGFDASFLATHTNGVFAAAVAGAPITDLVSNYGNHHWSSGIAETDHIETGQQRMQVPLYEDLPAYIRNSAVFNVQNMTTPLLLEAGDSDGTVFWHQSVELYNIARRAKKNVVMLVYNGEDHGLRQPKNQVDYQHRILAWFGHYLKGDEPETWITSGESFLAREAEVNRGGTIK